MLRLSNIECVKAIIFVKQAFWLKVQLPKYAGLVLDIMEDFEFI